MKMSRRWNNTEIKAMNGNFLFLFYKDFFSWLNTYTNDKLIMFSQSSEGRTQSKKRNIFNRANTNDDKQKTKQETLVQQTTNEKRCRRKK